MDVLEDKETLFVGTAEAEHIEMYLKAIWHLKERKEDAPSPLEGEVGMVLLLV